MNMLLFFLVAGSSKPIPLDMKDEVIVTPVKVSVKGERAYVLDGKALKVLVFNEKEFLFSFGSRGEGPGEHEHPISIAAGEEGLYVLEQFNGRVSIYTDKGKFKRLFTLEDKPENFVHVSDLVVVGENTYVSYDYGIDFLKVFARDGSLINILQKKEEMYSESLRNLYHLSYDPALGLVYLYSRFDSQVFYIDTEPKPKIRTDFLTRMRVTDDLISGVAEAQKKAQPGSFSSFKVYFPLVLNGEGKIHIIPSKPMVKGKYYVASLPSDGELSQMRKSDSWVVDLKGIPGGVRYLAKFNDAFLYINFDGELFLDRRF